MVKSDDKMGLMPLEYKDCITDSPYFRQKLHSHEKELDRTSQAIKVLTKEVKELVAAAKGMCLPFRDNYLLKSKSPFLV